MERTFFSKVDEERGRFALGGQCQIDFYENVAEIVPLVNSDGHSSESLASAKEEKGSFLDSSPNLEIRQVLCLHVSFDACTTVEICLEKPRHVI